MIRIKLTQLRSRSLFIIIVSLAAGTLAFFAMKVWIAAHWDSSSDPALWLKAAKLEQDNASYWEHAGLHEQWDLVHGDPDKAILYFRRATKINPRSDKLWMELASVYENVGDTVDARDAYGKAKKAHPISSDVAWRYGSFLLRQGDRQAGFVEIRHALVSNPSLTESAIAQCWHANPNISNILNFAIPPGQEYYLRAISFLLQERQLDAALAVWSRFFALNIPIKMGQAIPLVNALIDNDRVADAEQTWQQALNLMDWPWQQDQNKSLIFNGSFENTLADGGFDWREHSSSGVAFATDTTVFHSGRQSIRISFDGSLNVDFKDLLQYVAVEPSHSYHLSAYLRTNALTTDSGVRFLIYDPFHPTKVNMLTPNIVGSNSWTPVNVDLTTAADTDLLVIALRRLPSWKFDNKLQGTVWLDDVALVGLDRLRKGSFQ